MTATRLDIWRRRGQDSPVSPRDPFKPKTAASPGRWKRLARTDPGVGELRLSYERMIAVCLAMIAVGIFGLGVVVGWAL